MEQIKGAKEVVFAFYDVLFNKEFFDMDKMETLLGDNFVQQSDGHTRTREQIVKHFEGHKKMKQTSDIEFKVVYAKDDIVFAYYHIIMHKAKGTTATWQVLARFEVRDGKLEKMEQLSEVMKEDSK